MSDPDEAAGVHRLRALASRVIGRVGGLPAVRTLVATLEVYDRAGGGLVAGGLAYAALVALLPGLLLVLSVIGLLVNGSVMREEIVSGIATAVPPLEGLVRISLEQVSAGAVPTGAVAVIGLMWGSSRFYAALDDAFARIFHTAPRRNAIQRAARGLVATALVVTVPFLVLVAGSVGSWLLDLAPADVQVGSTMRTLWTFASPLGSIVLFISGTAAVLRFVPAERVPLRALRGPAVASGLALAAFTQVFTFVAPRLVGAAALYGTFVAVFALLAWLSIGFNVLLLGGAWTRVRALASSNPDAGPADPAEPGRQAGTDAD